MITDTFSKKHYFRRGFTLVESLVAISILLVALTATFSAAQYGLSSTIAVKARVTAFFLAQEALEAVRNVKDTNLIAQYDAGDPNSIYWLQGIFPDSSYACGGLNAGETLNIEYNRTGSSPSFFACGSQPCDMPLRNASGILNHSSGEETGFVRNIAIREVCNVGSADQKEAKVTVTVTWPGQPAGLVVSDNIFNWFAL